MLYYGAKNIVSSEPGQPLRVMSLFYPSHLCLLVTAFDSVFFVAHAAASPIPT